MKSDDLKIQFQAYPDESRDQDFRDREVKTPSENLFVSDASKLFLCLTFSLR